MPGKIAMLSFMSLLVAGVVSCTPAQPDPVPPGPDPSTDLKITWDKENTVSWKGGYGRVHRLNDGSLMAVYESGANGYCRFSHDNGLTWTNGTAVLKKAQHEIDGEVVWSNIANPEFAQLSATNPHHPGRIIYAGNIRPSETRSDLLPYSICITCSDDGGKSWSARRNVYESQKWDIPELVGCWEPFVLELPNGVVQIYFADETQYFRSGQKYQNISVIESKDGGDTWGKARIVAYTEKCRDGMPVVMIHDGNIYLAIEHFGSSIEKLHPQIVYSSVSDNWKKIAYASSAFRFDPMQKPLDYKRNYYGAPYIIATDNYLLLSYQSSEGSDVVGVDHAVMEVVVCPKDEVKDGKFPSMRAASRPVDVDQKTSKGLWNSMCHLGGDQVLAVSDVNGIIVLTRGVISGK